MVAILQQDPQGSAEDNILQFYPYSGATVPYKGKTAAEERKEYMNNTKVAAFISSKKDILDKELRVKSLSNKNIFVIVNLEAKASIVISDPDITSFDIAVMDSIYTVTRNGNMKFSPETIVRTLSGNTERNVTKKKVDAVIRSINKLSSMKIEIDCTNEFIARNIISKEQTSVIKGDLLPIEETTVMAGNHRRIMTGYRLMETPLLYRYAEATHQIISFDMGLFNLSGITNTEESVLIKRYLIRRIEIMKNKNNHVKGRKISYEWTDDDGEKRGLLISLGYEPCNYKNWKKKRNNIHKVIISILDAFVEAGYIHGYTINKKGQQSQIVGYTIKL